MGTCNCIKNSLILNKSETSCTEIYSTPKTRNKRKLKKQVSIQSTSYSENQSKKIEYFCSLKNKKFSISINSLLLCPKLPCNCIKRGDISLDSLQKEVENWEKEEEKNCSKHNSSFLCYCFECELMLCINCINKFHDEYFHNHHLYYKNNLDL